MAYGMPLGQQDYSPDAYSYSVKPAPKMPWVLLVLVLGGAGYGAYWGLKERGRLMSQASTATVAAATAEAQRRELADKLAALDAEKAVVAAERDLLTKSVQAKSSELAELKGTYDKLQEKMKEEIAHGDIQLTQSGGKLRVGLVDKILFHSGEAGISKRGEGVLARVGAILAPIEDRQILVSGHTDTTPISDKLKAQFPTNWELSTTRATTVVRFLSEKAGVPANRLVASGSGEHEPIATNKSPAGRARNRRIEILLTPSLAPAPIDKSRLDKSKPAAAEAKPAAAEAKPAEAKPAAAEAKPAAAAAKPAEAKK
jgi:chemotaxis protein MotB